MTTYEVAADVHDIYLDGDRAAVYAGDSALVLGPIAAALVVWVRDGVGAPAALADRAVERFGSPPGADADALITAQLGDLCVAGVLRSG